MQTPMLYSFQTSLPHLPVPSVKDTMKRVSYYITYLISRIKPVFSFLFPHTCQIGKPVIPKHRIEFSIVLFGHLFSELTCSGVYPLTEVGCTAWKQWFDLLKHARCSKWYWKKQTCLVLFWINKASVAGLHNQHSARILVNIDFPNNTHSRILNKSVIFSCAVLFSNFGPVVSRIGPAIAEWWGIWKNGRSCARLSEEPWTKTSVVPQTKVLVGHKLRKCSKFLNVSSTVKNIYRT